MSELAVVEISNDKIPAVFETGGTDAFLRQIEEQARSIKADVSTPGGRKVIAAAAHAVARSKTYLDSLGKELVGQWKEKAKIVDAERKKVRDTLDALKEEVRAPLTAWENAEKERVEKHQSSILAIKELGKGHIDGEPCSLEQLRANYSTLEKMAIGDDFEEFKPDAIVARDEARTAAKGHLDRAEKAESERIELEKLRKAKEEQDRIDRENAMKEAAAKEAREQAQREAEAKAKAALEQVQREKRESEERAEREAENAKRKAEQAAQDERDKIEADRKRVEAEKAKRIANEKHVEKVKSEAVFSLENSGVEKAVAVNVVDLIHRGEVVHIILEI